MNFYSNLVRDDIIVYMTNPRLKLSRLNRKKPFYWLGDDPFPEQGEPGSGFARVIQNDSTLISLRVKLHMIKEMMTNVVSNLSVRTTSLPAQYLTLKLPAMVKVELIPWDPESADHVERMFDQRVQCGWGADKVRDSWTEWQRSGMRSLFWLVRTILWK